MKARIQSILLLGYSNGPLNPRIHRIDHLLWFRLGKITCAYR